MFQSTLPRLRSRLAAFLLIGLTAGIAQAQSNSLLPDDPSAAIPGQSTTSGQAAQAQQPSAATRDADDASLEGKQTKRILGIVPNFRAVSVDTKLPAESVKEKFKESSEDAWDYSDFIFVAILSGVDQLQGSYPEFHTGPPAYARYYWHSLADQVDEDYQVEFVFPALLHQDSRYYTLGHGGFPKRFLYAFSRIAVTRTDGGKETFNASEVIGAGAAAGISNFYYPSQERTWTKTGQRWVLNVGLDGVTFAFKEFWPDLNSRFFHQKD